MWCVTSPLCLTVRDRARRELGYAAGKRARDKVAKYSALCLREGIEFVPCVLELFGGFGTEAVAFLKQVARDYAYKQGLSTSTATSRVFQRVAFASQLALARSIESRRADLMVLAG